MGRPPGNEPYSQPRPSTHGAFGFAAAKARMRRWTASTLPSSMRSTRSSESAPLTRWMCASLKPGRTSRPPRPATRVPGPLRAMAPAASPTKEMRPSRMATASAHGFAASAVQMRPPVSTRSADGRDSGAAPRPARAAKIAIDATMPWPR